MAKGKNTSSIAEWSEDQTIFITGVTGFLGKVLLYKLLKSCSNIKTVYVLLRPKKGKKMEERLSQLLSSQVFEEFKTNNPHILTKVKGISGDICEEFLGMEESDWQLLQRNVTLVFHVAASVRFDDTLRKAIFTNLRSTKYTLLLAKGMTNLKAFVHVSTAYANCNFLNIPEEVINTDFDPEKMIKVAENFEEHTLQIYGQNLLKDYPNTYVFTKNLAESLVYKERFEMPVVIIRPTIVVSSTKEPKPGWCDSLSSIHALFGAAGKGILRVSLSDPKNFMDYITADACVNAMIVAAWYRNQSFSERETLHDKIVFNVTDLKLQNEHLVKIADKFQYIYPLRNQLWRGFTLYAGAYWYYLLLVSFLHILPGLIIDGALKISGKDPILMRLYRKIHVASMALKPFMFNNFKFQTKNFKELKNAVPKGEREIFFLDSLFQSNLEKLIGDAAVGGRHLIGDPPEVYKEDIVRAHRLYWIDIIFRLILTGLFIWILPLKSAYDWTLNKMDLLREIWNDD